MGFFTGASELLGIDDNERKAFKDYWTKDWTTSKGLDKKARILARNINVVNQFVDDTTKAPINGVLNLVQGHREKKDRYQVGREIIKKNNYYHPDNIQNRIWERLNNKITPKDDLPMSVYQKIGKIPKTQHTLTADSKKGRDTYNANLKHTLIDNLGYKKVEHDENSDIYYVTDKKNNRFEVNKSPVKSVLAELVGDKFEIGEAIGGSVAGAKFGRKYGGTRGAIVGGLLGGVVGAGTGTIHDLLSSDDAGVIKEIDNSQLSDEVLKSMALDATGTVIGGAVLKGGQKIGQGIKSTYNKAKEATKNFRIDGIKDKIGREIIKESNKYPQKELLKRKDALNFAKEHNIKLVPTSVTEHPIIEQLVSISVRNPHTKQTIDKVQAQEGEKILNVLDEIIGKGVKATNEELSPLVKQEIGKAKKLREADVKTKYDNFKTNANKDIIIDGVDLQKSIYDIGDRYGQSVDGEFIIKEIEDAVMKTDELLTPLAQKGALDLENLTKFSEVFRSEAQNFKISNPRLSNFYKDIQKRLEHDIEKISKFDGDKSYNLWRDAQQAYREKVKIYGGKSEYTDIGNALESDMPNKTINELLSGEKAFDNANILKQEVGGTEAGDVLIATLARKKIDNALADAKLNSPAELAKIFQSDDIKIAKRLLGDEKSKSIDNIQKLFEMMSRTEKLIAGTHSPLNTASNAPLATKVLSHVQTAFTNWQMNKAFGKLYENQKLQEWVTKALNKLQNVTTSQDAKTAMDYIDKVDRNINKDKNFDFSDVHYKDIFLKNRDEKIARETAEAEAKKASKEESKVKSREEAKQAQQKAKEEQEANTRKAFEEREKQRATEAERANQAKRDEHTANESSKAEQVKTNKENEAKFQEQKTELYKNEDVKGNIKKLEELRDFLMTHNQYGKQNNKINLGISDIIHPSRYHAIINSLKNDGTPKNLDQHESYKEMMSIYDEFKTHIDEAYRPKGEIVENTSNKPPNADKEIVDIAPDGREVKTWVDKEGIPLDDFGNTLFAKGADYITAGLFNAFGEDEEGNTTFDPAKFILGVGGYAVAKNLLKNDTIKGKTKEILVKSLENADKSIKAGINIYSKITKPTQEEEGYIEEAPSDTTIETNSTKEDNTTAPQDQSTTLKERLTPMKTMITTDELDTQGDTTFSTSSTDTQAQSETTTQESQDSNPSVSSSFIDKLVAIESGGSYTAKNPNSSAFGYFQFTKKTSQDVARKSGKDYNWIRNTKEGQWFAMEWLTKDNAKMMEKVGIPVNDFSLYIAHQMGFSALKRLYNDTPSRTDLKRMRDNLPSDLKRTVRNRDEIISTWIEYFGGKMA